jgi:putative salt-induced outer membrane protein YdiY
MTRTQAAGLLALLTAGPVMAQATTEAPKYTYTEAPKAEAKDTGWKIAASGGLLWLAGNASSTSVNAGLAVTRDAVHQKYSLVAAYAFAKSSVYTVPAGTTPSSPRITSLDQLSSTTTLSARLWNVTPRFDQWLIHKDAPFDTSVYVLANIASDFAAGKKLSGGGQVGVSTALIKSGGHKLIGEVGFDFTYLQPYVGDGYSIASLRAALGYEWEITKTTKLTAGVGYLINVNDESGAPNSPDVDAVGVPAFQDSRVNGIVGLTTQVWDRLSLNLSWTGQYDSKPNLAQLPPGLPPNSKAYLKPFDSTTTIQFVYTFG